MRSTGKYPVRHHDIHSDLNGLLPVLQWLDKRLSQAIASLQVEEEGSNATPYPGLIQPPPELLQHWLVRKPEDPTFDSQNSVAVETIALRDGSVLDWLRQTFELSVVDLVIVAIALAPDLDRQYERLYAYLQDDVRCKRPTVDLVLSLLCSSTPDKLGYRTHFATDAPLLQQELLHLVADTPRNKTTLLVQELHLDEQVVNLLLGQPGLDRQLKPFCSLVQTANGAVLSNEQALLSLVSERWEADRSLRLYFQGADRIGKQLRAEAIAATLQVPLLVADLGQIAVEKAGFNSMVKRILREAQFQGALLYLDGLDALQTQDHQGIYQSLGKAIANYAGIVLLAGSHPFVPFTDGILGISMVSFALPDANQRQEIWRSALKPYNVAIDDVSIETLSDRFQLTAEQIKDAVAVAWNASCLKNFERGLEGSDRLLSILPELSAAARSQAGHDLTTLARKIEPKHGWEDLVLAVHQATLLQELCQEAKYQTQVWETWGFAKTLSLGRGLNVLFSGPPGTGKTFAAEVVAHELGLDLYQIDLSQMVSKYIGETEKNLNQVFTAAANSNAILLFDEADALFGKRSEVRDAHDRYANIETSYLLQKMEEYEGVAILTTNFRSNMDEAFVRRLRYIVEFALPGVQERQRIWERIWPESTPRALDLDLEFLANQFELPGANIRNIALRAAFLAASDGGVVGMDHLMMAVRREYQKMGKMLMVEQMGEYARFL